MIRFPKRPIKTDRIDDADILEIEVADDAEATSELHVIEDADLVLTPMAPEPEGVKNVMASLEAEVSRVLADQRSVLGASHASRASSPSLREDVSPPSAPPPSAPPHVHASAPVSVRPSDPRASAPSSPFVVAQAVVVASSPRLPAIVADPKANDGKVVVVREKPAFAWAIACLALGALGAIVGMKVASGLTRPQAPLVVTVPAVQPPVPLPLAPAPAASGPLAATAIAPTPESLLSAAPPAPTTAPAVVAFDEKDAVHVLAAPPPVAQAPQTPPAPPVAAPSPVSSASASAKAAVSAKPGDPPPLLPDAPSKPVVVAPPPPAKPARPKTPQEQLLEAQLKAASQ